MALSLSEVALVVVNSVLGPVVVYILHPGQFLEELFRQFIRFSDVRVRGVGGLSGRSWTIVSRVTSGGSSGSDLSDSKAFLTVILVF